MRDPIGATRRIVPLSDCPGRPAARNSTWSTVARASLNFTWGATPGPNAGGAGTVDDGTVRYGGTLVLLHHTGQANDKRRARFFDDLLAEVA